MVNKDYGPYFFNELEKLFDRYDTPIRQTEGCYQLLSLVYLAATRGEKLRFSSLFSRIAFAGQHFKLPRPLLFYLHAFRKQAAELMHEEALPANRDYLPRLGKRVLAESIYRLFETPYPSFLHETLDQDWPFPQRPAEIKEFIPFARVLAIQDFPHSKQIQIVAEDAPDDIRYFQYDIAEENDPFHPTIELIRAHYGFPVSLELVDVEVDKEGRYRPKAIIIDPDYLVDVTAIAECFKKDGPVPEASILRKFLPASNNPALLLGNIANLFLDELVYKPDADFKSTFTKAFRINPLQFAGMDDNELKSLQLQAQKHFQNLKRVLAIEFPALGIRARDCFLEPSFYSKEYGLQGRLDLFFHEKTKAAIVELKSGKPFFPNKHGLAINHYIQTLLYDLIIKTVFGKSIDPSNYILYSTEPQHNLRYAPVARNLQYEALQVRNLLLSYEHRLASLGDNDVLGRQDLRMRGERIWRAIGQKSIQDHFFNTDINRVQGVLAKAEDTALRYFFAYSGFIARELRLAKVGIEGNEQVNGQAALWRNTPGEKEAAFELLFNLELTENKSKEDPPTLTFKRTGASDGLVNFRNGDIGLLYPTPDSSGSPLSNQLFKCTIKEISPDQIQVELRARQTNDQLFRQVRFWNLEPDLMDTGFTNMFRSLFEFLEAPAAKRPLWLGQQPPRQPMASDITYRPDGMTPEQITIFNAILQSRDYFLLWGPPGTGKTNIMLRELCGHLFTHTNEHILVLAYTNRAVDEICSSIEKYSEAIQSEYLRIGSRFATAPEFQERLLSVQTDKITTRKALRELIDKHRIIVSTVATLSGRTEIFKLKKFDRVIIDEASQIPEPMLIGFLGRFQHVTLIGDHKQLPAVITQDEQTSSVQDPALQAIGLTNLRNSLFERLFKLSLERQWTWAYAQLSAQGRMHADIMAFPNTYFYGNTLQTLPEGGQESIRQHKRPLFDHGLAVTTFEQTLSEKRLVFISTKAESQSPRQKTNTQEATTAARAASRILALHEKSGKLCSKGTLGIITPYRAQIALIKQALQQAQIPESLITVDTVERFQGGARDYIILSLVTNSERQLESMTSLSEEGVDRKLNVALTRAREAVLIIGNAEILHSDVNYRALIHSATEILSID